MVFHQSARGRRTDPLGTPTPDPFRTDAPQPYVGGPFEQFWADAYGKEVRDRRNLDLQHPRPRRTNSAHLCLARFRPTCSPRWWPVRVMVEWGLRDQSALGNRTVAGAHIGSIGGITVGVERL